MARQIQPLHAAIDLQRAVLAQLERAIEHAAAHASTPPLLRERVRKPGQRQRLGGGPGGPAAQRQVEVDPSGRARELQLQLLPAPAQRQHGLACPTQAQRSRAGERRVVAAQRAAEIQRAVERKHRAAQPFHPQLQLTRIGARTRVHLHRGEFELWRQHPPRLQLQAAATGPRRGRLAGEAGDREHD